MLTVGSAFLPAYRIRDRRSGMVALAKEAGPTLLREEASVMRMLLTLIGGVVALAALKSASQLRSVHSARSASAVPGRVSLPRHHNRLALYYRAYPN